MIKEVENFERKELFDHYHSFNNPFMILTTKIDVTNIVEYCKKHRNFYATLGFLITKTANEIDAFKYRYKDGKIYYCDEIKSNYTQKYNNGNIGYFDVPSIKNYKEYINKFIEIQNNFLEKEKYSTDNDLNELWLSCETWFSFTGFVPPFNKEITIPQFIWDKYEEVDGKYFIHLVVMVHHGFADGIHLRDFFYLLEKNINDFDGTE